MPTPGPPIALELEPLREPSQAPIMFRGKFEMGAKKPRSGPWLIRDELSEHHRSRLQAGEFPEGLRSRLHPLAFWRDGTELRVQPTSRLQSLQSYTLAGSHDRSAARRR
jgi:hypothetical protein